MANTAGIQFMGVKYTQPCVVCKDDSKKTKLCSACHLASARYCGQDCQKKHWPAHKPICKQARASRREQTQSSSSSTQHAPRILVFEDDMDGFFNDVCAKPLRKGLKPFGGSFRVTRKWDELLRAAQEREADLLLITEFHADKDWKRLLSLAKEQGLGIHCSGSFGGMMDTDAFETFFRMVGRPTWQRGNYCRTEHTRHSSTATRVLGAQVASSLPITVNVKSQMIANVAAGEVLYSPEPEAKTRSLVPQMAGASAGSDAAAVLFPLGQGPGFLCYDGDVNTDLNMQLAASLAQAVVSANAKQ